MFRLMYVQQYEATSSAVAVAAHRMMKVSFALKCRQLLGLGPKL